MAIVEAIMAGERDPRKLAKLRDPRCHKSEQEIAEQLSGHWREDHLFSLRQALKMYHSLPDRIRDYDKELLEKLAALQREECRGPPAPKVKNPQKAHAIRRRGEEPLRQAWYRRSGVDLTGIDAIGVATVEVVLREYGPDLSRFPTEKKFVSHALLAPHRLTSGGKPVKKKAEQREHSGSGHAAHGGLIPAPERHGVRGLLPPYCATNQRRYSGVCHCQEIGHSDLPPSSVGAAVRR